jgi:hypothetical protein
MKEGIKRREELGEKVTKRTKKGKQKGPWG